MKKPPRLQNPAAASSIIRASNGEGSFQALASAPNMRQA